MLAHKPTAGIARALRRLLAAASLATLAACSEPRQAPLPPGAVVLALGDSVTAGYGVPPEAAWPARLAATTSWRVVNGGVTGDRSGDGLARLPGLLELHAPHLVLVELGGNDMLRKQPERETVANLEAILAKVRSAGSQVVLVAVPRPSVVGAALTGLSPAKFYAALADRHHVPLVQDALPEVLSAPELKLDPLHPNEKGHAALAEGIAAALRQIGYLR